MPTNPPVRADSRAFYYHAYTYTGAKPFTRSDAISTARNEQFYSLVEDLTALQVYGAGKNVPNITLTSIGKSCEGREMLMLSLGPSARAVDPPAVVITGGIHAREWIAAEFVYLLAEYLVMHYTAAPQNRYQRTIKEIIDSRQIHIIPMLNPDGNMHTVFGAEAGRRDWRKNRRPLPSTADKWVAELKVGGVANPPFKRPRVLKGIAQYNVPDYDPVPRIPPAAPVYQTRTLETKQTGVDLNRNYATPAWGYDPEIIQNGENQGRQGWDPKRELYFGPSAGSEVETANVQVELANRATASGIAASIDYHSYGKFILYPSETFHAGLDPDYVKLGRALLDLVHSENQQDYQLGSPSQLFGYDAPGSIIDHTAQQHRARAFTIELDPAFDDKKAKFELSKNLICAVFEKNIRGALAVLAAPRRPTLRAGVASKAGIKSKKKKISQTTEKLLTWDVYHRGNQLPA